MTKTLEAVPEVPYGSKLALRDKTLSSGLLVPGQYWCDKCMRPHRETSRIGKAHFKHGIKNFFVPNVRGGNHTFPKAVRINRTAGGTHAQYIS